MSPPEVPGGGRQVEDLARGGDWLATVMAAEAAPSLYHELAGEVLALHEAQHHFEDDRYGAVVDRGADALTDMLDGMADCSLGPSI